MNIFNDWSWTKTLLAVAVGAVLLAWAVLRNRRASSMGYQAGEFVEDLTERARSGKLGAVIGRDEEIDRVIRIIARRSKNNPLLIGPPGVGKTAIIEGLAQRIVSGRVPEILQGKRILSLKLGDLISGTSLRGEMEKRFQALIGKLEQRERSTILFIDEVHMIDQAKGVAGSLDLSDMLKPALARGDISVIGATTWQDYQRTLKNDPAMDRRFQPVLVGEPSQADALEMLRGVKSAYEKHHHVRIDDKALSRAVALSAELITGRFLPDKALDVIDEAAAKISIEATLGHKFPMAIIDAASKKTAHLNTQRETEALQGELKHFQELKKEFPSDRGLSYVSEEIKEHLAQARDADEEVSTEWPLVTEETIESIVTAWKGAT